MTKYKREDANLDRVKALFKKCDDDYIEFKRIKPKDRLHPRPDICALLYLHQRFGGKVDENAIVAAEHDEIWLAWKPGKLFDFNEQDALYLMRCGVRYGDGYLVMFV